MHKVVQISVPTPSASLSLPHPTYNLTENTVRPVNGKRKKERSALLIVHTQCSVLGGNGEKRKRVVMGYLPSGLVFHFT